MNTRLVFNALGYLGLIPFVLGAWLAVTRTSLYSLPPRLVFVSYSAIILSFLGGVLWGRSLSLGEGVLRQTLLAGSNVVALVAWVGLLASDKLYDLTLVALLTGYAMTLLAESLIRHADEPPLVDYYRGMRWVLTALVVAIHGVVLLWS